MRFLAAITCVIALIACQRERRDLRPAPAQAAIFSDAAREGTLQPGGVLPARAVAYPTSGNAFAISEGQRLFGWYNCTGCHSHGGGGIGPPLIKEHWIYGGEPENLFETLVKGRPNGMPTWGGRIPEYQMWQIVAYIRSMNHLEPQSASPARTDSMEPSPTIQDKRAGVTR